MNAHLTAPDRVAALQPVIEDQLGGLDSPLQPPELFSQEVKRAIRQRFAQKMREVRMLLHYCCRLTSDVASSSCVPHSCPHSCPTLSSGERGLRTRDQRR